MPLRRWWAALTVFVLAFLSLAIWRAEVEWIKGWAGLDWLVGYPWAAVPICVLVATSILVSVVAAGPASVRGASAPFLATASAVSWLSFEAGRRWLETDLTGSPAWPMGAIAFCAAGIFLAIDRLLLRLRPWTVALFVVALVLVLPASWLLLQLIPAHGYRDSIHSIKAGYPTLWTNLLLGGAAALAARFGRVQRATSIKAWRELPSSLPRNPPAR